MFSILRLHRKYTIIIGGRYCNKYTIIIRSRYCNEYTIIIGVLL